MDISHHSSCFCFFCFFLLVLAGLTIAWTHHVYNASVKRQFCFFRHNESRVLVVKTEWQIEGLPKSALWPRVGSRTNVRGSSCLKGKRQTFPADSRVPLLAFFAVALTNAAELCLCLLLLLWHQESILQHWMTFAIVTLCWLKAADKGRSWPAVPVMGLMRPQEGSFVDCYCTLNFGHFVKHIAVIFNRFWSGKCHLHI